MNMEKRTATGLKPRISFVVIGYNEAATLPACLESIQQADLSGVFHEIIYVDGGSSDDSLEVARKAGIFRVLGGDRRRRAAENRNLGLDNAAGDYVQFLDGDMILDPLWPKAAMNKLDEELRVAVVFGQLRERNEGVLYKALQIDWQYPEGEALYCGGAAMFRKTVIQSAGGFPEDVAYGEEPLLCWRIRNDLERTVYHLHQPMALHDLAYGGFADYWRRNIRVGATYAEIEKRLRRTKEPFWGREVKQTLMWSGIFLAAVVLLIIAPLPVRVLVLGAFLGLIARKWIQAVRRGHGLTVGLVYALHTYCSKIGAAFGIVKWRLRKQS